MPEPTLPSPANCPVTAGQLGASSLPGAISVEAEPIPDSRRAGVAHPGVRLRQAGARRDRTPIPGPVRHRLGGGVGCRDTVPHASRLCRPPNCADVRGGGCTTLAARTRSTCDSTWSPFAATRAGRSSDVSVRSAQRHEHHLHRRHVRRRRRLTLGLHTAYAGTPWPDLAPPLAGEQNTSNALPLWPLQTAECAHAQSRAYRGMCWGGTTCTSLPNCRLLPRPSPLQLPWLQLHPRPQPPGPPCP